MRDISLLLALPASILTLLATPALAAEKPWPYNLPRTAKYYPEHAAHLQREAQAQEKLARQTPVGMRKLSDDPGEKFFLQDWQFSEDGSQASGLRPQRAGEELASYGNDSVVPSLYPVFSPLIEGDIPARYFRFLGRSIFERAYQCPAGTTSCASIGQPDSCCGTGETCVTVTNTGNGPVGCCPAGTSCGNTVSDCDTAQGYTSCPNSSNGGCCIPGYACQDVGCVLASTETTTTTLPIATVTAGVVYSTSLQSGTTVTYAQETSITPSPYTGYTTTTTVTATTPLLLSSILSSPSTVASTQMSSTPISTDTETVTTTNPVAVPITTPTFTSVQGPLTVCSTGFHSCPASLGGGCCPTGQACGSAVCPDITSSTASAMVPVSASDVSTATSQTTTTPVSGCPTNYYMCSAVYLGGCCQVGRNCDSTSCPAPSTTILAPGNVGTSDGTTVVVTSTSTTTPGGTATSAAAGSQGSCNNGWFSCAASAGGGCCPSGYVCGASCSATVSGVASQPKEAASEASVRAWAWSFLLLGVSTGLSMVLL